MVIWKWAKLHALCECVSCFSTFEWWNVHFDFCAKKSKLFVLRRQKTMSSCSTQIVFPKTGPSSQPDFQPSYCIFLVCFSTASRQPWSSSIAFCFLPKSRLMMKVSVRSRVWGISIVKLWLQTTDMWSALTIWSGCAMVDWLKLLLCLWSPTFFKIGQDLKILLCVVSSLKL